MPFASVRWSLVRRKSGATRRDLAAWFSALSLVGLARPRSRDDAAEQKAVAVARAWLDLVDAGRYATSWDETAPVFKSIVPKEEWGRAVRSVRAPLGRCLSRQLRSRELVDSLPGAPTGPYAVLLYSTDFERKRDAIETITPALSIDDGWRVAGYFIN